MKEEYLKIIANSDWAVIKDQDNIKMIQIQNGKEKINIYWGKGTVYIPHLNRTIVNCKLDTFRGLIQDLKSPWYYIWFGIKLLFKKHA